jgi:hypothetical protein
MQLHKLGDGSTTKWAYVSIKNKMNTEKKAYKECLLHIAGKRNQYSQQHP